MPASFLVLGDQLSTDVTPWSTLSSDTVILIIETEHLTQAPRHLTRTALYLLAIRAFAERVRSLGFTVDYRRASSFAEGIAAHRAEVAPTEIMMNHPRGRRAASLFTRFGVTLLDDPFYLTPLDEFRSAVTTAKPATMEAFYRRQRRRLNVLMNGDDPVGDRWNFDEENRLPLPKGGGTWPAPWSRALTDEEQCVVDELAASHPGGDAVAYWPRTRGDALDQLTDAVTRILPHFGPYEDAASTTNWHLAHSRLSVAMNLGLLHPREVVDAVVAAYDQGLIPLASTEGFLRQIIGWREWVWGWHQLRDDSYRSLNALGATAPLPETWRTFREHPMNCLDSVLGNLRRYGWTHHIERLMVMTNAATLSGIDPLALNDWMADNFVDGAEWVMEVNVIGMGTFADGGLTSTKPYIAGGNYLKKMTNFCQGCRYSPTERTGERACPLTNGYWSFLADAPGPVATNYRIAPQRKAAQQRPDLATIQAEASVNRQRIYGDAPSDYQPR